MLLMLSYLHDRLSMIVVSNWGSPKLIIYRWGKKYYYSSTEELDVMILKLEYLKLSVFWF